MLWLNPEILNKFHNLFYFNIHVDIAKQTTSCQNSHIPKNAEISRAAINVILLIRNKEKCDL